jgi:hypothetical protein
MYIAMDQLERLGHSCVQNGREICMHLASFTGFTYQIGISSRIEPETHY